MTRNTKLSNLAIAAIALLAASASSFAQTQSAVARTETSKVVAMAAPELAVPSRSPQLTASIFNIEPKSVTALSAKPHSLSPASFMARVSDVSTLGNQHLFGKQTTIYEMDLGNSKKQFRADDDNGVEQRKRVSFVPSLGQKLPDSKKLPE
jgi:hypothetical protein